MTRAIALRMVHAGTVAASPEALEAWIAKTDDLRERLRDAGYGSGFAASDLFPLFHAYVEKATAAAPPPPRRMSFTRVLRQLAIVEGVSTLVLFGVAMPLKYFAGMPLAVTIVGSIHGVLFVALVLMLVVAIRKVPISVGLAIAGVVAAVLPGGPFLLERRLAHLERREKQ